MKKQLLAFTVIGPGPKMGSNSLAEALPHEREVKSAQFSPDGQRMLTASWDHTGPALKPDTSQPMKGTARVKRTPSNEMNQDVCFVSVQTG